MADKNRAQKNRVKDEKGYVLLWVVAVVSVSSLFLYTGYEGLAGVMKASSCLEEIRALDKANKNVQEVLWEHYIHEVKDGAIFSDDTHRISKNLKWALTEDYGFEGLKFSELSAVPFSVKPVLQLSLEEKLGHSHPLDTKNGSIIAQELSFTLINEKFGKAYKNRYQALLKEIPSTEFAFISMSVFSPKNTSFPITVSGDSIVPGFRSTNSGSNVSFETLFTKFYGEELSQNGSRAHVDKNLWVGHKFSFGYGMHPYRYFLPEGVGQHYANQSYTQHPEATILHFDGESLDRAFDGISVLEFNDGPKRVIVDISNLKDCPAVTYIYCTTEAAENVGVLVKGGQGQHIEKPRAIITNGRVWLWGDNRNNPVVVGTTSGSWTLTDNSWIENTGSLHSLNLHWNGYIASPHGFSVFSSPQSSKKEGKLTINGTLLVGGRLSGNLGSLEINKDDRVSSSLSPFAEKFLMPYSVTTKKT